MDSTFDIKTIKAIIGLGNPGQKYSRNRHSIGFRLLDALAEHCGVQWRSGEHLEYALAQLPNQEGGMNHEVILIKPLTFMNNSGRVLSFVLKKGIKSEQIMVMHDELEKPFGQCLIRFGGSHKGHNGLKSIMATIGSDFWRLKFGIGRPADKDAVPDYVLSDFPREEEACVPELIDKALTLLVK